VILARKNDEGRIKNKSCDCTAMSPEVFSPPRRTSRKWARIPLSHLDIKEEKTKIGVTVSCSKDSKEIDTHKVDNYLLKEWGTYNELRKLDAKLKVLEDLYLNVITCSLIVCPSTIIDLISHNLDYDVLCHTY
jgi:hypothetical protein